MWFKYEIHYRSGHEHRSFVQCRVWSLRSLYKITVTWHICGDYMTSSLGVHPLGIKICEIVKTRTLRTQSALGINVLVFSKLSRKSITIILNTIRICIVIEQCLNVYTDGSQPFWIHVNLIHENPTPRRPNIKILNNLNCTFWKKKCTH